MNVKTNNTASIANPLKQATDLVRDQIDAIGLSRHLVYAIYMTADSLSDTDQRNALATLADMIEVRLRASGAALYEALSIIREDLA